MPEIPPGFVLEKRGESAPPPPEGFVLEQGPQPAQQPQPPEREIRGTSEKRTVLTPTFGVREEFKGQGIDPFTTSAREKAKGLPELIEKTPEDFFSVEGQSESLKIAFNTLLLPDTNERAQVLKEMGLDVYEEGGIQFVRGDDGKEYVVNRPGMSRTDAYVAAGDILSFLPAGRIAAAGKSLIRKIGRGFLTSGVTATAREGAQKAVGGEFDKIDIAIETALGSGSEIIGPILKGVYHKLSPAAKAKANQAKSIQDLIDAGVDIDELRNAVKESDALKSAGFETPIVGDSPFGAAKLEAAAARDPAKARKIETFVTDRTSTARESANKMLSDLTPKDTLQAMETAAETAGNVLKNRKVAARNISNMLYEKVLSSVDNVQIDTTNMRVKFKNIAEDRAVPAVRQAILEHVNNLKPNMSPRALQEVLRHIRDTLNQKGSKSVFAQIKFYLRKLEKEMVAELDNVTNKQFSVADASHARMKTFIEKMEKSLIGKVETSDPDRFSAFLKNIFNPDPTSAPLSKKFMHQLNTDNPQAAKDLYGAYYASRLNNVPLEGKPSDILEALFGGSPNARRTAYDLAPDAKTQKGLQDLESILKVGKRLENISEDKAIRNWINGQMDSDMAHFVYVRLAISRALVGKISKRRAEVWYDASTNPKWADDWKELLETKGILSRAKRADSKRRQQAANTVVDKIQPFFERVEANLSAASGIEGVAPGAAIAAEREITDEN